MALEIKAKSNDSAEIMIYDTIGDSWLGGLSAKDFAEEVKALGKLKNINVRINSDGGSVFDGVAIYNTLVKNSARIEVDIDGLAASIASIIAMAGNEIRIAKNAFIMIHDPWVLAGGTADDLRKQADIMDGVRDVLLDTYVDRTGYDRDSISDMMKEETWLDSGQALDYGFADAVTDELAIAACAIQMPFKHLPSTLQDTIKKQAKARPNYDRIRQRLAHHKQVFRKLDYT